MINKWLNDKFYPVVYNKFRTSLEMNLQILRLKPYTFQGHVCTHFSIHKCVVYFYYNLISWVSYYTRIFATLTGSKLYRSKQLGNNEK